MELFCTVVFDSLSKTLDATNYFPSLLNGSYQACIQVFALAGNLDEGSLNHLDIHWVRPRFPVGVVGWSHRRPRCLSNYNNSDGNIHMLNNFNLLKCNCCLIIFFMGTTINSWYTYRWHMWPDPSLTILLMPIDFLNYFALSVPDEGYSRNASCALNLISMGFFCFKMSNTVSYIETLRYNISVEKYMFHLILFSYQNF